MLVRAASRVYAGLLRLYPPAFRAEFADEMQLVFREGALAAARQGAVLPYVLRELRDLPPAAAQAHWQHWAGQWQTWIDRLRAAASPADLPPPAPDGRSAWRLAGLEVGLFGLSGAILIALTYLVPEGVPVGWQRDLEALGRVILPLTIPLTLIGLARGLPRWAYPGLGLLLSYAALSADRSGLGLFLIVMLAAASFLALLAVSPDPDSPPLPTPLRRIGQSLTLDWTRLSFGVYGALPLAILAAFDDAQTNLRTPFLAVAALAMIVGALIYCRSRTSTGQMAALLGGLSLAIWAALLDKAAFAASLPGWLAAPRPNVSDVLLLAEVWFRWAAPLLAPAVLGVARLGAPPRRPA